jgi:hypothetical protein
MDYCQYAMKASENKTGGPRWTAGEWILGAGTPLFVAL